MAVVLVSSDVFVQQKLASVSVHGCTLTDRLFSKANGKWYFRTDRDVRGSTQQQVCLQTCSPEITLYQNFKKYAR